MRWPRCSGVQPAVGCEAPWGDQGGWGRGRGEGLGLGEGRRVTVLGGLQCSGRGGGGGSMSSVPHKEMGAELKGGGSGGWRPREAARGLIRAAHVKHQVLLSASFNGKVQQVSKCSRQAI